MGKINIQRFADESIIEGVVAPVNVITSSEGTALSADGVKLKMPEKDLRTCIVVVNTDGAEATVTLVAPSEEEGTYARADIDVTAKVPAGAVALIPIESARYATKGNIVTLKGSDKVKVTAFKRWEN